MSRENVFEEIIKRLEAARDGYDTAKTLDVNDIKEFEAKEKAMNLAIAIVQEIEKEYNGE